MHGSRGGGSKGWFPTPPLENKIKIFNLHCKIIAKYARNPLANNYSSDPPPHPGKKSGSTHEKIHV